MTFPLVVALLLTQTTSGMRPKYQTQPAFTLLRANAGVPSAVPDFCSLFSSELTGNYFCLNGDGTQRSAAATTLSAVGSPASQSQRMCPNGPNCGAYTSQRITSGNRFATANVASPTGSFSLGCLLRADDVTTTQDPLAHWTAGSPSFAVELAAGTPAFYTHDGTAATLALGPAVVAGAWHLVGASFTFVGAGAVNSATFYVDGVAGAPNATMRPAQAAASIAVGVGARPDGVNPFTGNLGPCFLTEKVISPTTWAAMASALIPTVSGSRGEAITYSRASTATCTVDDGSVSVLPSGRPCVNGSGLLVEPAGTNTIVRSEEIDNVAWSSAGTPTTTANQYAAPNGTLTADKIVTTGSGHARNQIVTVASTTSLTGSAWVRSDTGTSAESVVVECNGTTITGCTCATSDGTSCSTATFNTPDRCAATATVGTTPVRLQAKATCAAATITGVIYLAPGQYGVTFGTGGFWGAQLETGAVATSYTPTAGTAATRAAVSATVPTTGWPVASGEVEFTFVPNWSAAPGTAVVLLDTRSGGSSGGVVVYVASNGTLNMETYNAATPGGANTGVIAWTAGAAYKIKARWQGGTDTLFRNDAQLGQTASQAVPSAHGAVAFIGQAWSAGQQPFGTISNLSVRP